MHIGLRSFSSVATSGVLVAAVFFAASAMAAPLESDTDGPVATPRQASSALPRVAVQKSSVTGSKADANGNGLSDGLEAKLAGLGAGDAVKVIVTFAGPGNAASAQAAVGAFSVKREFRLINAFAGTMTAGQARALASVSGVFRVEEDSTVVAMLEAARSDYGVKKLRDEAAASIAPGVTGAGVVVCVVDTGAFSGHEQFVNEGKPGENQIVAFKDFIGDAFGDIRDYPYDDVFHGTHVAAIIAGDGTGPSALAGRLGGVAPGAKLAVAKVLNYQGSGSDSIVMAGVEWCAKAENRALGLKVINMSLGVPTSSDGNSALEQLVDALAKTGIVTVVAAGNSGGGPSTIGSPAAARGAVTVGAAGDYSSDWTAPWAEPYGLQSATPFSSRGPTADGRIKPDIMGPGATIASAAVENLNFGIYPCAQPCYAVASGTSMATPAVAGIVALMFEANPNLTVNDVRRILYDTAHDRFPGGGKDNETGFGLVDAHAAVRAAQAELVIDPLTFPGTAEIAAVVPNNGQVLLPVHVTDPSLPVMVTVTIEGKVGPYGWTPDIDTALMDANLQLFEITPILPGLVYPGTASTCPAGSWCGAMGRVETLYVHPTLAPFNRTLSSDPTVPSYYIQLYPYDGFPNAGKGGSVKVELFNATTPGADSVPYSPLTAVAGPDLTVVPDAEGNATIDLDGGSSTGSVTAYSWSTDTAGITIPDGMFSSVKLPTGDHVIYLTVADELANTSTDSMLVSVKKGKGGGGGNGGGGNGGGGGGRGGGPKNASQASLR